MGIGKRVVDDTLVDSKAPDAKKNDVMRFEQSSPKYAVNDLVLSAGTLSSLLDFLAFKDHYDRIFDQWGLSETHKYHRQTSVNFYGPPGTGKTMAAHAVAHELDKEIILVSYADVESKYVGETSKNLSALFRQAEASNAVIFFDEADAILSRRVSNMSNSTDVSVNQTRSVLLTLLDQHKGTVIFATNFIENYDHAFMRRITSHINFTLPDTNARKQLWGKFIPVKMPTQADIDALASMSDGLSGAEISNCIIKSALSAARREQTSVTMDDFSSSISDTLASKRANTGDKNEAIRAHQRPVTEDHVRAMAGDQFVQEVKK